MNITNRLALILFIFQINNLYSQEYIISKTDQARTQAPDSATSQFFINHVDNSFLNHGARGGAGYTTFGHVISGLDVVDSIAGVAVRNVGPYQNVPSEPVVIESITRVN